ncbi:hypothetical protein A2U01_0094776, partial [Trifolium medium]|nr:hypothetical protein [Trifolium medium]
MEKLKKDYEDKLTKVKEDHASETKRLGEEAKVLGETITSLTQERDTVVATSSELAGEKAALEEEAEE